MTSERGALPPGWTEVPISAVAQLLRGVSYEKSAATEQPKDGHLPILRATNIQDEHLILDTDLVYVPERFVKPEQLLKPGDVVICMSSGSKHLVGKTAQLNQDWAGSFGTFCAVARFQPVVDTRFAGFFFGSMGYRNLIREKASGVNINNLRHGDIETLIIPLPPLPEQQRIVAEIEKQFTRLDVGVAALKRVQANLRRYRASVLKAACEGRLTPQDPDDEPAERLLARIRAERRAKWEAEHPGKRYVEPAAPETDGLAELPVGWCWATVEMIANPKKNSIKRGPFGSAVKKAFFVQQGYKVYEQGNVIHRDFDRGNYFISQEKFQELIDFEITPGDLLITGAGTIGRTAVVPHGVQHGIINQALVKLSLDCQLVDVNLFQYNFEVAVRKALLKETRGSAMQNLSSVADLKRQLFALPPLSEQHRIIGEVERRLSVVAKLEATVAANLARAGRLRQAVLKRAFEGRLVAHVYGL